MRMPQGSPDTRTAGAAALATLLGACALSPVYATRAWFLPVVGAVLVVLAGGLALRVGGPAAWARLAPGRPVPRRLVAAGVAVVPLVQLFLLTCLMTVLYAPLRSYAGVLPTPSSLTRLVAVFADGSAELREQATPALPLTGLLALTTLFVGVIAVTIDLVAVAGHQAGLAGLGLLILYCIPVSTMTGGIGVFAMAAPAAGLALLLWADQRRRLVVRASRDPGPAAAGGGAAVRIAASALVAGLVVGTLVPTLAEGSLSTGLGGGSGSSTGNFLDPAAALKGELTLAQPLDLLHVDASVTDPGYLRAVSLDRYDVTHGWTLSNLDGEVSIVGDGRLAPLPPEEPSRTVSAAITVVGHDDRFLPVLSSPLAIQMSDDTGGAWRFDSATGTVFGRGVTTSGRNYQVIANEPRPTIPLLAAAPALAANDPVQQRFAALPKLDPRVTDLVNGLVAGADSPYARVRRILDYLTDPANGFIYSLSTAPGTSGDNLLDFLRLRRGYCEQYAGAMAVMVRAAGVPARVALGYTPGTLEPNGTRKITSDDAHAWVEVYFAGLGWVPFDPTPISVDRRVGLPWAPRAGASTPVAGGTDVAVPTTAAPARPTVRQDRGGGGAVTSSGPKNPTGALRPVLIGVGALLGVLVLIALPGGVRALQRRRRLADGGAGALWDELTATATDLGLPVHPAWTPRRTAGELAAVMARPGGPVGSAAPDAVLRLALGEEAVSYGPGRPAGDPEGAAALRTARRGLLRAAARPVRFRAALWPASLVSGAGGRLPAGIRRRVRPPARHGRRPARGTA
jgi:hypothetical protein